MIHNVAGKIIQVISKQFVCIQDRLLQIFSRNFLGQVILTYISDFEIIHTYVHTYLFEPGQ